MKVKMFDNSKEESLEQEVNEFLAKIADSAIISIQFSTRVGYAGGYYFSVMITYKQ